MEFSTNNYSDIGDKELVGMVLEDGNQEAILHMIFVRYAPLLKKLCRKYYYNLYYYEQLQIELFIHLKKNDWHALRSFGWRSSFGSWLGEVAGHVFIKKIPELIGINPFLVSLEEVNDGGSGLPVSGDDREFDNRLVLLGEAIQQLEDPDQRFILYREFEGYEPKEIAVQLEELRRKEGRLKTRMLDDGRVEEIIPNAEYIHMLKGRAKANIRAIINKIKN